MNIINFLIEEKIIVRVYFRKKYRLNYRRDFKINRATSRETTNYRKSIIQIKLMMDIIIKLLIIDALLLI